MPSDRIDPPIDSARLELVAVTIKAWRKKKVDAIAAWAIIRNAVLDGERTDANAE